MCRGALLCAGTQLGAPRVSAAGDHDADGAVGGACGSTHSGIDWGGEESGGINTGFIGEMPCAYI